MSSEQWHPLALPEVTNLLESVSFKYIYQTDGKVTCQVKTWRQRGSWGLKEMGVGRQSGAIMGPGALPPRCSDQSQAAAGSGTRR